MKKILSLLLLLAVLSFAHAQGTDSSRKTKQNMTSSFGFGIKAGLNFSNVSNAASVNSHSQAGFHAGVLLGGASRRIFASRTELLYSQQGYGFSSDSASGSNRLGYILLAQLMAINITKFVQIQFGGQISYLLNAKVNSNFPSTGNAGADQLLSLYNRLNYGYAGGVEIHPIAGVLLGARYSISLNNLYKSPLDGPAGAGTINYKNNVVQLFAGYRF